jgi:hypothetical protein
MTNRIKQNFTKEELLSSQCSKETVRFNFFLQLITNGLTKFADSLADVKTVLPWVMASLNVPVWLIALLVPLRESGSLLPQLWIAPWIKSLKQRKWAWIIGALGQAVALAAIIFALIGFSLFRSACSITSKDVMGRTIPKTSRGKLGGWSISVAGLITMVVGVAIIFSKTSEQYALYLIACAAIVWIIAAFFYTGIRENAEAEDNSKASTNFISMTLLIKDDQFRHFVIVRTMLLSTALSTPFYTLIIQQYYPQNHGLGFLLIVSSLAGILSGPLWGRMADWSSRRVLVLSSFASGLLGLMLFFYTSLTDSVSLLVLLGAFFCALFTHEGVRLGRKTYVVDMATGNKRTDSVAVGNTFIGLILLVCAAIGLLFDNTSAISAIIFLASISLLASVLALRLPEVELLAK